jgi:hypothetical protein
MLVFSTPSCERLPLYLLSELTTSKNKRTVHTDSVWLWGVGDTELCCRPYSAGVFNTLFLTRFRTYKIATPPHTKTSVKTTFRDWCLFSSFVHASICQLRPGLP